MKTKKDYNIDAWLHQTSAALLLFQDNRLTSLSPYAKTLLPGLELGVSIQDLLGQSGTDALEMCQQGTLLLPVELMGLSYDGTLTPWEGGWMLELFQPASALSASALRSMAEGLGEPLTALMALMPKLLPQLEETEKNMARAAQVNQSLYTLRRAVSNIRFAAAEQSLQPNLKHCNLTLWLTQLAEQLRYLFELSNRRLETDFRVKNAMCEADLHLLEQALMNVISNAIKYTQPGGLVTLSLHRQKTGGFRITVQDDGCGIPSYRMGTLFCQQEHRDPIPDPRDGIGLGLGMTKKIIEAHGGRLLLNTIVGSGTTVCLALPASHYDTLPLASTIQLPDYSGGYNRLLLELSDVLPSQAFDTRGIDL